MAQNNALIFSADPVVGGGLRVAPIGTDLSLVESFNASTDLTGPTYDSWIDLGNMGDDGFVEKLAKKNDKKRNFGGDIVKIVQSEFDATLTFTFMESINGLVLQAIFGEANVTITPATGSHGTQVMVNKNDLRIPDQSWLIDTYDSETQARYRNWVPDGMVFDVGDIKVATTDIISYKITLQCFQTLLGDGTKAAIRTWTDDGILVTGS
jgi:hypothetical protein